MTRHDSDSLNGHPDGSSSDNGGSGASHPPSWILDLRARLEGTKARLPERDDRIVFLVPLFVDAGGLWTVLGEDTVTDEGALARTSFPAASLGVDEPAWPAAAALIDEVLGIDVNHGLQIGELPELRTLGGLRVLPLVVAIPRPEMAGRTLSVTTEGGLALFPLHIMSLLEPQQNRRQLMELPGGPVEVDVITIDDHQLWGPSLEVLEALVAVLAT